MAHSFLRRCWRAFLPLLTLTLFAACGDDAVAPEVTPGTQEPPPSPNWPVDNASYTFRFATNAVRTLAVSSLGTFEFDGTSWRQVASGLSTSDVAMSTDGVAYAVSQNALWRLEGDEWTRAFTPMTEACDIYGDSYPFLGAIWAGADGKIVAIGPTRECSVAYYSIHFHYNGSIWSEQWSSTGVGSCVWGASENDVFAGGSAIHHFDGNSWTKVFDTAGGVIDIWGRSASDVYAIGNHTVYHYDGAMWSLVHTDNAMVFRGIGGLDDGGVVVWGAEGRMTVLQGGQWTPISIPSRETLTGVWGESITDLHIATTEGLLRKQGNTSMRQMGAPTLLWESVFVASENNVYAAGEDGTLAYRGELGWDPVLYEKGVRWLEVWGPSPDDVYLVGTQGRMMHYDGDAWLPEPTITTKTLSSVWGIDGTFFVAGDGVILKREGGTWTVMPGVPNSFLRDIWGISENDVFAVGDNGTILHYDGIAWTPMPSGTQRRLWAVRGLSSTDVFAGGEGSPFYGPTRYIAATVLHYDGTSWTRMESQGISEVNALWGTGPNQLLLAGNGIYPLVGSNWGPSIGPGVKTLHGCSPTCIFAVKERSILRYEEL